MEGGRHGARIRRSMRDPRAAPCRRSSAGDDVMHAVTMREYGGADVLRYEDLPDPQVKEGEVLVRVEAAALNHLDIDLREGTSRLPLELPHVLGCEGVGRIEE